MAFKFDVNAKLFIPGDINNTNTNNVEESEGYNYIVETNNSNNNTSNTTGLIILLILLLI